MKLLFISLLCFITCSVNAKIYYVSASGSDGNTNNTLTTPWRTIDKVNSFGVSPGYASNDTIAFRCGDGFYGTINVSRNHLTFKSYSTGAKPLIWGLSNSLIATGSGPVYTINNVNAATSNLLVVYINGIPMEMGRYPNSSAANGGYLTYESFSDSASITDNNPGFTVSVNDWDSAEICVRKDDWTLERNKITGLTVISPAVTYNFSQGAIINPEGIAPPLRPPHAGYGYFIQNAHSTLDTHGEWYFNNATKQLSIYLASPPANYTIRAATLDVLFNIGSYDTITIQDLTLKGANRNGIFSDGKTLGGDPCSYITVSNCDFSNFGARAINLFRTNNAVVQNCTFDWCLSTAVQVSYPAPGFTASNSTISNCTFNNIAPYNGMGCFFDGGDFTGIHSGNNNALIQYNNIQNTGKGGIFWQGNNVTISKNFLNNTVKHLNDYGAIYTYTTNDNTFTNRTIANNIILNTLGQPYGTNSLLAKVAGIYLDGKTMAVNVTNNTVAYSGKNGIHCNNPTTVTLSGNTLFDNLRAISFARWKGTSSGLNIDINQMNLNANNNICYSRNAAHKDIYYTNNGLATAPTETMASALSGIGTFNNNYYGHVNQIPFETEIYSSVGGSLVPTSPMSLQGWNAASTQDAASSRIKQFQSYVINSYGTPSNLFSNPEFNTASPVGMSTFNGSQAIDNTAKITGANSLRIDLSTTNTPSYSVSLSEIETLVAGKSYLLSFKTLGTNSSNTVNNVVRASLRLTANQDIPISEQVHSFNDYPTPLYHEFVFFNALESLP